MDVIVCLKRLPAVFALGVMLAAAAACAIQLREPGNEADKPQSNLQKAATLAPDLVRCRTVTSEQGTAYERCRKIWAENRRRFFGQKASSADSAEDDPSSSPPMLAPKDQSRMPQGYPSIATPGEGDQ